MLVTPHLVFILLPRNAGAYSRHHGFIMLAFHNLYLYTRSYFLLFTFSPPSGNRYCYQGHFHQRTMDSIHYRYFSHQSCLPEYRQYLPAVLHPIISPLPLHVLNFSCSVGLATLESLSFWVFFFCPLPFHTFSQQSTPPSSGYHINVAIQSSQQVP